MVKKKKQKYTTFTKQDLLFIKKYPRLFTMCSLNDLSYDFVNRCYKRYKTTIDDDRYMNNLELNGYKRWWFGSDKETFEIAIRIYLANYLDGMSRYLKRYTRGDVSLKIAEMSGFKKYMKIKND